MARIIAIPSTRSHANKANTTASVRSVRSAQRTEREGERTEQHPLGVFCLFAPPRSGNALVRDHVRGDASFADVTGAQQARLAVFSS